MDSQLIATLKIDDNFLRKELDIISDFNFNFSYKEFICGTWKSCMLWNENGISDDTMIYNYITPSKKTAYGEQLPYIFTLINQIFNLDSLKFVRLVILSPNSVIVPHRDYLELKRDFLRFHVPLQTDQHCFNSEENTVYQMKHGEIWYINATKIHSAASFSDKDRLHLILDFDYVDNLNDIIKFHLIEKPKIPDKNIVKRDKDKENFNRLVEYFGKIVDSYNFYDVLAILIKRYFTKDIPVKTIFDCLLAISRLSENIEVLDRANMLREYCLLKRDEK